MDTLHEYRQIPGLTRLVYQNIIEGEKQIAYFRLLCIFVLFILTFIVVYTNKRFSVSDITNLICLGIATTYTIVLFVLVNEYRLLRVLSFISSTIDIALVTIALYLSRFDPDSSIASIVSSGAFAIYATIILFSIRRHDPLNTLFTGFISAIGYLILLIIMSGENAFDVRMTSKTGLVITNDFANEFIKVTLLAVTGFMGFITAKNFDLFCIKGLREQKEKEYIRSTFGRYVSDELVDKILSHQIPTDGERRDITVMFIDVKNFTALSEKVPPQLLIKILNTFFSFCIPIIRKYHGFIDKFIGDAIMVEFGVPIVNERHKEDALDCAIAIYRSSPKLQRQIQMLGVDWKLEFGIGINSGDAALGNIGTSQRKEYTAMGDTVNTASRIEELTRRLDKPILVGENTFNRNLKSILDRGRIVNIRGKTTPVTIYAARV